MNDWNATLQATRNTIASYQLVADSLRGVLLGQGFIVLCQDIPLAFDIEDGCAVRPRSSQPQTATRFTRENAELVAAGVQNGNGMAGEVMHVRDAIEAALAEQRDLLALLEDHTNTASNQQQLDIKSVSN